VLLSDLLGDAVALDHSDLDIRGLTADSRAVRPGYLFAAFAGGRDDGRCYIADAVARGAVAVLADEDRRRDTGVGGAYLVTDPNPRRRLALIAARFHPAQPRVIAAVTGTNGKTSVAAFCRQIWTRLGHPAAALGTLGVTGADGVAEIIHTTPDPITLHRVLDQLARSGIDHLALEASSHGLDQCRLDAVRVAAAAFTNLSQDHLDYHPDAAAYLAAKLRLFDTVMAPGGTAVLNGDAPQSGHLARLCRARGHRLVTVGAGAADFRLVAAEPAGEGQVLTIEVFGRRRRLVLPLVARFQAENALMAAALVIACGGETEAVLGALESLVGVPGRMQAIAGHPRGAAVYVDYSHTPDSLEHALAALRPHVAGRLVAVFGCGGDRDRAKRPMMGRIAARLADRAIVTDDNPRGEDPAAIRAAVRAADPRIEEIGDRAEAIRRAVAALDRGDVLLIAGKGHERGQTIGDAVVPFDDAAVARAVIAALAKERGS